MIIKCTVLETVFILSFILFSWYYSNQMKVCTNQTSLSVSSLYYAFLFLLSTLFSFPSSKFHAFSSVYQGEIYMYTAMSFKLLSVFPLNSPLVFGKECKQAKQERRQLISDVISNSETFSVYQLYTSDQDLCILYQEGKGINKLFHLQIHVQ